MRFLTTEDLAEYYGKSADTVSPTDTPLSEYICGYEVTECVSCGSTLDVQCAGVDGGYSDGFQEVAECDDCELKHSRTRTPVCEQTDYQFAHLRTDEREEYVCSYCRERHPITEPDGAFEVLETPCVQSFEEVTVACPCGGRVLIDQAEFPSTVSCSECSRTYSFDVDRRQTE